MLLSFDRAPLERPFDALGLVFARLDADDGVGPGDSAAAVAIVEGVVAAEETG